MAEKPRVLVVDDDPEFRALIRATLEEDGFTMEEADDGDVALPKVESFKPHLIALDLVMPRMGALAFLKAAATKGLRVVVVLVTGYAESQDAELLRRDPRVLDIFRKPLRYGTLGPSIKALLEKHKLL